MSPAMLAIRQRQPQGLRRAELDGIDRQGRPGVPLHGDRARDRRGDGGGDTPEINAGPGHDREQGDARDGLSRLVDPCLENASLRGQEHLGHEPPRKPRTERALALHPGSVHARGLPRLPQDASGTLPPPQPGEVDVARRHQPRLLGVQQRRRRAILDEKAVEAVVLVAEVRRGSGDVGKGGPGRERELRHAPRRGDERRPRIARRPRVGVDPHGRQCLECHAATSRHRLLRTIAHFKHGGAGEDARAREDALVGDPKGHQRRAAGDGPSHRACIARGKDRLRLHHRHASAACSQLDASPEEGRRDVGVALAHAAADGTDQGIPSSCQDGGLFELVEEWRIAHHDVEPATVIGGRPHPRKRVGPMKPSAPIARGGTVASTHRGLAPCVAIGACRLA